MMNRKLNNKKKQSGQIIIILLLIMLVGLSVGLALTQRSVTDVTTSTQIEQSSRAFSAAEAGLEKALGGSIPSGGTVTLDNDSSARVDSSVLLPIAGTRAAIEYPPIGRETTAQFWFVDPALPSIISGYDSPSVELYFGNENTTDKPAVEVAIVMKSGNNFYTKSYYFDSDQSRSGPSGNNFDYVNGLGSEVLSNGILGNNSAFFRRTIIGVGGPRGPIVDQGTPSRNCPNVQSPCTLIMARVRFLYINENHKVALKPTGTAQFPPQIQIYNTTGSAGQSQRQIQAFRVKDVVPTWFDFAIFSINEIVK